jgi:hypothetical protein
LRIDVKDNDGKIVEWAIVGGSVQQIARLGLSRTNEGPNALHPGDQITVTIVPAIDGKSPVGLLRAITYPDGHTVRFGSTRKLEQAERVFSRDPSKFFGTNNRSDLFDVLESVGLPPPTR